MYAPLAKLLSEIHEELLARLQLLLVPRWLAGHGRYREVVRAQVEPTSERLAGERVVVRPGAVAELAGGYCNTQLDQDGAPMGAISALALSALSKPNMHCTCTCTCAGRSGVYGKAYGSVVTKLEPFNLQIPVRIRRNVSYVKCIDPTRVCISFVCVPNQDRSFPFSF
jgi:hypothetical protein